MAFHFSLVLLGVILLNGMVLGDNSAFSGALAGPDGERNAPSRGGEAGCIGEGRARNGDNLVVLASARTTPSEAGRKSDSFVKRTSGQSSLRNRNEARNDHAGVGSELHDQPATGHKAQTGADDKHGMKLPHARRPAASRNGEGGLTSKNPKESAEVLDRKKEFENMVSGIIAEEADDGVDVVYPKGENGGDNYDYYGQHGPSGSGGVSGPGVSPGGSDGQPVAGVTSVESSSVNSTSTSGSESSSVSGAASSSDGDQSPVMGNKNEDSTNNENAPKDEQNGKREEVVVVQEDGNEKGEKQLEQESNKNNDERETNNSSDDAENEEAPSSGNSAFLSGSSSPVMLVFLACLCARAC
ncbi:hypothetical protein ERJ75_000856800 [Trypanosoma vivax]|nr:hypothetical protein ERJ75_000856800 [Trypanosoma vivax]